MTQWGVTADAAGLVVPRQPDSPAWDHPSASPFEPSPLTAPDQVPTALLHPPVTTNDPPPRVAAGPIARRLADLFAHTPVAFDVPVVNGCLAATLAAHCPDLFLVSAGLDRRPDLVAEITATAARAGQRVLVLANNPEAVFTALARHGELAIGRAVAPSEDVTGRPCVAHTALAHGHRHREHRRAELTSRAAELQTRIAAAERRDLLLAEADALTADLGRVEELAAAAVEQSDAFKQLVDARATGVAAVAAHAARRAEVEQELSSVRQTATQQVGFFKKLFGGGSKPEPTKVEGTEARLRDLDASAPPDPHAAFAAAREKLLSDEAAAIRARLEARLGESRATLNGLPAAEPLDELCRALDDITSDLAQLDAGPPVIPVAALDAVRVVIGPPAAVGYDPFLSDSHPEVEPRFDRVVWADADELTEDAFAPVYRLGAASVLVGSPDPLHPPGVRNGTPRAPFFSGWWERLHTAAWAREFDRPLARLLAVDHRDDLLCEPLHGNPDIEVRWADRDGTAALAEVLFPAGTPLAEAKRFLAREANEVRCGGYGACEWDTADGVIRCRWPAVEAANGEREDLDLGDGVREQSVAGVTAVVTFCTTTWTHEAAATWLGERLVPPMRTAVL